MASSKSSLRFEIKEQDCDPALWRILSSTAKRIRLREGGRSDRTPADTVGNMTVICGTRYWVESLGDNKGVRVYAYAE